jgi:aromatic ring-opening dioxygenase catalytic subunit (LigB family)
MRQPAFFIPHGAGPCFFLKQALIGPPGTWEGMRSFLGSLPGRLPERPRALLVVSAHWETDAVAIGTSANPGTYHDWYDEASKPMPEEVRRLDWPAPGEPDIARTAVSLLREANLDVQEDPERGFDHGVFVPMLLAFPGADIPTVPVSIRTDLDPSHHLAVGRALAPLRDQGVAIVCSGSSFHNMSPDDRSAVPAASREFDAWLAETVALQAENRSKQLTEWKKAPGARLCHRREEHLVPLFVAAGAADTDEGQVCYREDLKIGFRVSAHRFG